MGPTASGKSDLAVAIAKFLGTEKSRKDFGINGAEIISADSRQVYKGMDIGTGKVPKDKKVPESYPPHSKFYFYKGIPHHLLDVASPKRTFTVANYKKLGGKAIKKILKQNKIPVICGGTGFYADTLLYGYSLPEIPPQKDLRTGLEKKSEAELFEKLRKLDPERAKNIDSKNKRRLVRALEIVISSGKPVGALRQTSDKKLPYSFLKIGIKRERDELKGLISKRLSKRIKQGMICEVRNLKESGVSGKRLENLGLEYRYINRFLEDKITKTEMLDELEKAILRYAKRQMTWFKRDKRIRWVKNKDEAMVFIKNFIDE